MTAFGQNRIWPEFVFWCLGHVWSNVFLQWLGVFLCSLVVVCGIFGRVQLFLPPSSRTALPPDRPPPRLPSPDRPPRGPSAGPPKISLIFVLSCQLFKNTTKIPRGDPQERGKNERKLWREMKKARNFGLPGPTLRAPPFGTPPFGAHLTGFGRHLRGPTPLPHPFTQFGQIRSGQIRLKKIGQMLIVWPNAVKQDWPNAILAKFGSAKCGRDWREGREERVRANFRPSVQEIKI